MRHLAEHVLDVNRPVVLRGKVADDVRGVPAEPGGAAPVLRQRRAARLPEVETAAGRPAARPPRPRSGPPSPAPTTTSPAHAAPPARTPPAAGRPRRASARRPSPTTRPSRAALPGGRPRAVRRRRYRRSGPAWRTRPAPPGWPPGRSHPGPSAPASMSRGVPSGPSGRRPAHRPAPGGTGRPRPAGPDSHRTPCDRAGPAVENQQRERRRLAPLLHIQPGICHLDQPAHPRTSMACCGRICGQVCTSPSGPKTQPTDLPIRSGISQHDAAKLASP